MNTYAIKFENGKTEYVGSSSAKAEKSKVSYKGKIASCKLVRSDD